MSDSYLGEIRVFAFGYAPQGFMACAGQQLNTSQYAALFSLLGIAYGGNGSSTFNLPDMRGRLAIGTGALGGSQPIYTLGQTLGSPTATLSINNLPAHIHPAAGSGPSLALVNGTINASTTATGTGNAIGPISIPAQDGGAGTNIPSPSAYLGKPSSAMYALGSDTNLAPFTATLPTTVSVPVSLAAPFSATATLSPSVAVTVGVTGAGAPFSNLQPSVAMTYVICSEGIYPVRP